MAYFRLLDTNFLHEMNLFCSPGKVLEHLWNKGLILEANYVYPVYRKKNLAPLIWPKYNNHPCKWVKSKLRWTSGHS